MEDISSQNQKPIESDTLKKPVTKPKKKGAFVKGDPRINRTIPGPGRTAGYSHFLATLTASLLDGPVSDTDPRPFVQVATDKWKEMVIGKERAAMNAFVNAVLLNENKINGLDGTLTNQKKNDIKFLNYQLHSRSFDQQQEVLFTKKPTAIMVCGRRSGKTETLATKIVQTAISHDKGDIIYIGKTYTSAYEIIWTRITDLLKEINMPFTAILSEQTITLASGVNIYVRGAHTIPDIDKLRGHSYRLCVIDEIQSIRHLRILINEILLPAMADYTGSQLFLSGTPPRIKGSYMEEIWQKENKHIAKYHWDLTSNLFIPDNEKVLQRVMEENNYTKESPIFQREWLGLMGVYDTDALVFQPTIKNALDEINLKKWVEKQNPSDLYFSAGLDLGYSDSDAFVILLGSYKRPEKFIVFEHKKNKQDISQLVEAIHAGYHHIKTHAFLKLIPGLEHMKIWTDAGGGGKKIAVELRQQYKLPCIDAIKTDKPLAIQLLAEEIKTGRLMFSLEGQWADECQKIIYERDDNDNLLRDIDDSFHPDLLDAILYALRPIWRITQTKIGDENKPLTETPKEAIAQWGALQQQQATQQAVIKALNQPKKERDFLDKMFDEKEEE